MKRTILTLLLLCGLLTAGLAEFEIFLGRPHDNISERRAVYLSRVELKPFIAEYERIIGIIRTRFRPLEDDDIAKIFGPRLQRGRIAGNLDPTNSVTPLFAPPYLVFSGLRVAEDKSHQDLYAVDNLGYVQLFYELDGKLATAVLYLPLDDRFVPFQSPNDFSRRLEWDKAKFDALQKWLDTHLVVPAEATNKPPPSAATKPTN